MIYVLRLNHRRERDKRITTHVALVARAFGAAGIYYTGDKDEHFESSIMDVVSRWGGNFFVKHTVSWREFITTFHGTTIHLTMYGINIDDVIGKLRDSNSRNDLLIIVGGEKVPSEMYNLVDFNVAIGNQPHSEVAALAVLLDRLFGGNELKRDFGGHLKVIPQQHGKKIIDTSSEG